MTTRERTMSGIILVFILVAGFGFFGYYFVLVPLKAKEVQITKLQDDIDKKQVDIVNIQKRKADLERWRQYSLPANVDVAGSEYYNTLVTTLRAAGFTAAPAITPKGADVKTVPVFANKTPIYKRLTFAVTVKGDLATLVDWLERFYKLPLMHQIRELTVTRAPVPAGGGGRGGRGGGGPGGGPNVPSDLDINMTIEALVLDTAEDRKALLPDVKVEEMPKVLARETKDYESIAGKNLFYGAYRVPRVGQMGPALDVRPHVRLDGIVSNGDKKSLHATLYDRYQNYDYHISPNEGFGFKVESYYYLNPLRKISFSRPNARQLEISADLAGGTAITLQPVHLNENELVFHETQSKKHYKLGVGQSLADMTEVSKEELEAIGIKVEETPAAEGEKKDEVKKDEVKKDGEKKDGDK